MSQDAKVELTKKTTLFLGIIHDMGPYNSYECVKEPRFLMQSPKCS